MDVSSALHEGLWLEFRDEVFFQAIDYEQIPFRCRKFHEHGNLFRECPMNKPTEKAKDNTGKDQEGFSCPNGRQRANRRNQHKTSTSIKGTVNAFEVLGSGSTLTKNPQVPDLTQETQDFPSQAAKDSNPDPTREILQGSELAKDLEGDADMTASEIGIEDMELSDILEREGMDLNTIVEQWKQKGVEHVPEEEIDRVNFLFLTRQDVELKG